MPYNVVYPGNHEDSIEIPEMDAFMADLEFVFAKHGVAITVKDDYDDAQMILLTTFDEWDPGLITDNMDGADEDIPFIARARAEQRAKIAARHAAEAAARAERQFRTTATIKEALLKEKGITLSDGHYMLVKVGEGT